MTIQLFGYFPSRSNRPMWALEEIGVDYEFYKVDVREDEQKSEAFLKINPCGKIPALKDGDLTIFESGAICNYLAEKFPEAQLAPKDDLAAYAQYHQWMIYVLAELEQPLWVKAKHMFGLPKDIRVPEVFATTEWEFQRALSKLPEDLGSREFFLGDRFSMVDIFVTHTLQWAMRFEYQIPNHGFLEYAKRMSQRPAFQRMKDKEALAFSSFS